MKKIIILSFAFIAIKGYSTTQEKNQSGGLLAVSTPTYSQVNKIRGGLFGYKDVDTTRDDKGNKITVCQKPGIHKCIVGSAIVIDGNTWSTDSAEALDRHITSLITPENTSGTILYQESVIVSYSYNIETDKLSYSVYSIQSATENGLTW